HAGGPAPSLYSDRPGQGAAGGGSHLAPRLAQRLLPGADPVRTVAPGAGDRFGVRRVGLCVAGTGLARRPCRRISGLSPPDGHVAARCRASGAGESAHRSRLRLSGSPRTALVTELMDLVGRAWRTPRGRAGALVLLGFAAASLLGPFALPDPLAQPNI